MLKRGFIGRGMRLEFSHPAIDHHLGWPISVGVVRA